MLTRRMGNTLPYRPPSRTKAAFGAVRVGNAQAKLPVEPLCTGKTNRTPRSDYREPCPTRERIAPPAR